MWCDAPATPLNRETLLNLRVVCRTRFINEWRVKRTPSGSAEKFVLNPLSFTIDAYELSTPEFAHFEKTVEGLV